VSRREAAELVYEAEVTRKDDIRIRRGDRALHRTHPECVATYLDS
jgi:hypothetical protein